MEFIQFDAIARMAEAMKDYDENSQDDLTWRMLARVAYEALEDYKRLTEDDVQVN